MTEPSQSTNRRNGPWLQSANASCERPGEQCALPRLAAVVLVSAVILSSAIAGRCDDAPRAGAKAKKSRPPKRPMELLFERLDKNGDQNLDVDEFLAGSIGKAAANKRDDFRKYDKNGNGVLHLQEFLSKGRTVAKKDRKPPTLEELFNHGDSDGDGRISVEEYTAGRSPADAGVAAMKFRLFDDDKSGFLSMEEFKITPPARPDDYTQFKGLDKNGDRKLSRKELTRYLLEPQAVGARRTFKKHDADQDGYLSFEEFKARETYIANRKVENSENEARAAWIELVYRWLMIAMVVLDIAIAVYVGYRLYRWRMRAAIAQPAAAPPPSQPTAPEAISIPDSIDDFDVK